MLRYWLAAVSFIVQLAAVSAHGQSANIVVDPLVAKHAAEFVGWIAYGTRMSNYLNETGRALALRGPYEPSFDVELVGREAQAISWREINRTKPVKSVYLDDLVRVSDAGYLREYVWRYYRRPAWGSVPSDLRLDQFNAWARDHLASHVPFTGVRLEFPTDGSQPRGGGT